MTVSITIQHPEIPEDLPASDFGFSIDYVKEVGPAHRAIGVTYRFIEACETFKKHFLGSIGVTVGPVIILEDIELGSLLTNFKLFWDKDLKTAVQSGNPAQILGTLFARGIELLLRKTNSLSNSANLFSIQDELFQLTKEVDIETLSIRTPIGLEDLIESIGKYERIKELLNEGDHVEFIRGDQVKVPILPSVTVDLDELRKEATRETLIEKDHLMIMIVRKPDYLANSQWQFHYRDKNLAAVIEDREWLSKFQQRSVDVRPGDALKCKVRIETAYGYNHNVVSQKYYITKVIEVLENQGSHNLPNLFDD